MARDALNVARGQAVRPLPLGSKLELGLKIARTQTGKVVFAAGRGIKRGAAWTWKKIKFWKKD